MIDSTAGVAFDKLAAEYDAQWSDAAIGRHQRSAVWLWMDPLFQEGDRVLDLGCGTGVDADHLMQRGIEVTGIDASREMVRMARARGVDAQHMAIEALGSLKGEFDGAISNFGALNCVSDLETVALALGHLVRKGRHIVICMAGRCCAWEIAYYLLQGKGAKAFRRWNPAGCEASLGVHVEYPSVHRLIRLFRREFRLFRWCGIGLCVPPSYVRAMSETTIARLADVDRSLAHRPIFRFFADHWLLLFERI